MGPFKRSGRFSNQDVTEYSLSISLGRLAYLILPASASTDDHGGVLRRCTRDNPNSMARPDKSIMKDAALSPGDWETFCSKNGKGASTEHIISKCALLDFRLPRMWANGNGAMILLSEITVWPLLYSVTFISLARQSSSRRLLSPTPSSAELVTDIPILVSDPLCADLQVRQC